MRNCIGAKEEEEEKKQVILRTTINDSENCLTCLTLSTSYPYTSYEFLSMTLLCEL